MKRREFLYGVGAGAAAATLGLSGHLERPRLGTIELWLFVTAHGGWDSQMICDAAPVENTGTPRYRLRDFFRAHRAATTVFDGITATASCHDAATRALELASSDPRFGPRVEHVEPVEAIANPIASEGLAYLDAFERGRGASAHLGLSGFDSHADHVAIQSERLATLFEGVDAIVHAAARRGLDKRLAIWITSEIGRDSVMNAAGGTDHSRRTSALLVTPTRSGAGVVHAGPAADHGDVLQRLLG